MKEKKIVFSEEEFASVLSDLSHIHVALGEALTRGNYLVLETKEILHRLSAKRIDGSKYEKVIS